LHVVTNCNCGLGRALFSGCRFDGSDLESYPVIAEFSGQLTYCSPGQIRTDPHVEFINVFPAWVRGNSSKPDENPVFHVDQVMLDLVIEIGAYLPVVILRNEAVATFH
jgi:hypothetical protein